ncbi:Na+/solute symporter [Melanogaster broomeanus]|nr:Na+/solute symporter [Melanogaster broomeanus]
MSSTPTYSEFRPLLSQSVGYGVVVGVGFFFAFIMLILTTLQRKFSKFSPTSSEEFTSASRSVKPGLVCCGIVSAWTWSATLLQSSTAAYTFGVSGPWWYGVGGTIQVCMFGMVAAKVKMNANGAHTFLEIVRARFGTAGHIFFTFYGFLCILIVCGSLLLGGAATVNALTGMNVNAACFLLPIGIAVYVIFGGLRATFICDWSHTLILFIIIYLFIFRAYGTSPAIGSVSALYDLLQQAAIDSPVATILSGFAGVFCDQGYWQRAIASHPESTTKAYMLGGLSWFAPNFPTYPSPLSPSQSSAGLAAPAAAAVLMGKRRCHRSTIVTSAASAELIGVSSLFSYDIYRTYIRPQATGEEIVRVSHYFICFWAVWMGCWASILNAGSINLGWLFYVQGVVLSPAVIPIALTVSWSKLTRAGVFCGAVGGACLGMLAWMIGCWKIYDPADYDFSGTRAIAMLDGPGLSTDHDMHDDSERSSKRGVDASPDLEKHSNEKEPSHEIDGLPQDEDQRLASLTRVYKKAFVYSTILTVIVVLIVPLPMFFSEYVFSRKFYSFWTACSIVWAFASGTFCIVLPLWESRKEMASILWAAYRSSTGASGSATAA